MVKMERGSHPCEALSIFSILDSAREETGIQQLDTTADCPLASINSE
jgi:hypothetical protein